MKFFFQVLLYGGILSYLFFFCSWLYSIKNNKSRDEKGENMDEAFIGLLLLGVLCFFIVWLLWFVLGRFVFFNILLTNLLILTEIFFCFFL